MCKQWNVIKISRRAPALSCKSQQGTVIRRNSVAHMRGIRGLTAVRELHVETHKSGIHLTMRVIVQFTGH